MEEAIITFGTMGCIFLGSLIVGLIIATIRFLITGKKFWHPYNE